MEIDMNEVSNEKYRLETALGYRVRGWCRRVRGEYPHDER